ncbi:hypothetical protein D3C81_804370 [compost metagenome]
MDFEATGKLIYDPVLGREPIFTPWWVILKTPQDIVEYYHYWFEKKHGIKLIKPKWGSHISLIRGEQPSGENKQLWKKYDGMKIKFQYSNEIKWNNDYVWIDVNCDQLLEIREQLGLKKQPEHNLHITIGKFPKEVYIGFKSIYDVVKLSS